MGALALLPVLAGCGIRNTSVPVDAGPAPSRVACAQPTAPATPVTDAVKRRIYLVCSGQIAPVEREVRVREAPGAAAERSTAARELIEQLQAGTRAAETVSGFYSAVPASLEVLGPRAGDPVEALRLSQDLDDLPSFAPGQIVCTLAADTALAPKGAIVLGGPDEADALRSYTCTPDLRTGSDAADSAGAPVH